MPAGPGRAPHAASSQASMPAHAPWSPQHREGMEPPPSGSTRALPPHRRENGERYRELLRNPPQHAGTRNRCFDVQAIPREVLAGILDTRSGEQREWDAGTVQYRIYRGWDEKIRSCSYHIFSSSHGWAEPVAEPEEGLLRALLGESTRRREDTDADVNLRVLAANAWSFNHPQRNFWIWNDTEERVIAEADRVNRDFGFLDGRGNYHFIEIDADGFFQVRRWTSQGTEERQGDQWVDITDERYEQRAQQIRKAKALSGALIDPSR